MASRLALLASQDPDFKALTERWANLPKPVRAGILAMVKAAE